MNTDTLSTASFDRLIETISEAFVPGNPAAAGVSSVTLGSVRLVSVYDDGAGEWYAYNAEACSEWADGADLSYESFCETVDYVANTGESEEMRGQLIGALEAPSDRWDD